MVPVASSASMPMPLNVLLPPSLSSMSLVLPPGALLGDAASPRGRKRTNDSLDSLIFSKRHSNSDLSDDDSSSTPRKGSPGIDDERRAHHNELERRRRDHIKDHFMALKDTIPLLEGEKSSRALILKRAVEYITMMQARLRELQTTCESLSRKHDDISTHLMNKAAASAPVAVVSQPAPVVVSTSPVPAMPAPISPLMAIPTTSTACFGESLPAPTMVATSTSSFSPVIPRASAPVAPVAPAPPALSTADLASMLMALQSAKAGAPDLASLISFNSLALRDTPVAPAPQFVSPILF